MESKAQPGKLRELLSSILAGDLRLMPQLSGLSQDEIDSAGIRDFELSTTCGVVLDVMKDYVEGRLDQTKAQAWGQLVRWHGFRGINNAFIDLPFELAWGADERESDVCIDLVANIDELGDAIDGEITPEIYQECLDEYQAFLSKKSAT